MFTKHLILLPSVVTASAAFLSTIQESSVKHQEESEMDFPVSYGDPHVDGFSYRSSELVKRDGDFVSLPLYNREEEYTTTEYTTELYMGFRGERIEVAINMNQHELWVKDAKALCRNKNLRPMLRSKSKSKRDSPEHFPNSSQSLVAKNINGVDYAKISENEISSVQDISKRNAGESKAWGYFKKFKSNTFKIHRVLDYGFWSSINAD